MIFVDIGTAFVKIVDSTTGRKGILESPLILHSSVILPDEKLITNACRRLIQAMRIAPDKARLALPVHGSIFARDDFYNIYNKVFKVLGVAVEDIVPEGEALANTAASREDTLVIDLGDQATNFFIIRQGALKRMSMTDFGIASLYEPGVELENVWRVIIKEAERTGAKTTKQLCVLGGGGKLQGVSDFLSRKLALPLVEYKNDPQFAVALGLMV